MNDHQLRGFIKTCSAAGMGPKEITALLGLHQIASRFDNSPGYRRGFFKAAEEAPPPGAAQGSFSGSPLGGALIGAGITGLLAMLFGEKGNRIRNAILGILGGGVAGLTFNTIMRSINASDLSAAEQASLRAAAEERERSNGGEGGVTPEVAETAQEVERERLRAVAEEQAGVPRGGTTPADEGGTGAPAVTPADEGGTGAPAVPPAGGGGTGAPVVTPADAGRYPALYDSGAFNWGDTLRRQPPPIPYSVPPSSTEAAPGAEGQTPSPPELELMNGTYQGG